MERHNSLSFALCYNSPPWWSAPRSPSYSCKLFIHRLLLLALILLPSILPIKIRFSRPPFRSTCPKNLISFLSTSALSKTSSLLTLSVQGILITFRKDHTSHLSNRFFKTNLNVSPTLHAWCSKSPNIGHNEPAFKVQTIQLTSKHDHFQWTKEKESIRLLWDILIMH